MPYVAIEDFRAGLDRRRLAETAAPGSVRTLRNAHLSRGAEIEKRKALASLYDLPAGTFGFEIASGKLYVFGSGVDPGVPAGVTYQRLQHPDGLAMLSLVYSTVFNGKVWGLAQFSDGNWPFYDGVLVADFKNGVARASMVNNSGIATHLAALIDASPNFSASAVGNVVTVTGPSNGDSFTVTTTATNGGAVDDQTLVSAQTQTPIKAVTEILATGTFRIVSGAQNPGVIKIDAVKVNGVTITNGAVNWTTSNSVTAAAVAASINAKTSVPDYTATSSGDKVTIKAAAGSGSSPNGLSIEVDCAVAVIVSTGGFDITGGTNNPGVNKVNQVKVDGVNLLAAAVNWATSDSATAAAVALAIVANAGVSGYIAWSSGRTVQIGKIISTDADPAGLTVFVNVGGDVTAGNVQSVQTTISEMDGGLDAVAGTPQKSTLTVGGTFEIGDKFFVKLTLNGKDEVFGADFAAGQNGTICFTHQSKVYVVAGPVLLFSAIDAPTKFNSATDSTGAGFINMSNKAAGSETLTGLGVYQNNLVVPARRAVQIWFMDPDPGANTQLQVLANVGARAPRSVVSVGDSDVFFVGDSGIRSIRVRDASKNAGMSDVGTPIDDLVLDQLASLTDDQIAAAAGDIEPRDGRYWLAIDDQIYVFTYFPAFKISGWSVYDPGVVFSDFRVLGNQLYGRSGDKIYLYGGADGATYDTSEVEIELPFISAKTPATWKSWTAIDVACEGAWSVYAATDPKQPDIEDLIAIVDGTTFGLQSIPYNSQSEMLKLRLVNSGSGAAKLGMVIAHYDVATAS